MSPEKNPSLFDRLAHKIPTVALIGALLTPAGDEIDIKGQRADRYGNIVLQTEVEPEEHPEPPTNDRGTSATKKV